MWKSILTVVASYALSVILVLLSDPILTRMFPGDYVRDRVPSDAALMSSTGLFVLASIVCAWLCARFAPANPARHVLWFFVIGEVMGIVSIIPNWSKGWPHWYWLSWLLTWPISCYLGLLLAGRRPMAPAKA